MLDALLCSSNSTELTTKSASDEIKNRSAGTIGDFDFDDTVPFDPTNAKTSAIRSGNTG